VDLRAKDWATNGTRTTPWTLILKDPRNLYRMDAQQAKTRFPEIKWGSAREIGKPVRSVIKNNSLLKPNNWESNNNAGLLLDAFVESPD